MAKLCELKVEKLINPTGIDVAHPRFSWKFEGDESDLFQKSYRIVVKDLFGNCAWDSGEVNSASTLACFGGGKLLSHHDYSFTVTATLTDGQVLSESATFSTGIGEDELLSSAKWIAYPINSEEDCKICPVFRREFIVKSNILSAKVYTSGLGVYEAYINGKRISNLTKDGEKNLELKPGYTQILERKLYNSFDITHLLEKGANCISAISSHGWWADTIADNIGRYPCFLAVVCIDYKDGNCEYFVTDETWSVSKNSPLISASIYDGEKYDGRVRLDFMKANYKGSDFENAFVSHQYYGKLTSIEGANVIERKDRVRKPIKLYSYSGTKGQTEKKFGVLDGVISYDKFPITLKKGRTLIVDFGQNASGRERIVVEGKRGETITISHAEMLNDNEGIIERGNDNAEGSLYLANLRTAKATTEYIIGNDGKREEYSPIFTFYGFRYISLTATCDITLYETEGLVLTSVSLDNGFITTGSEKVNRLIENGRWGMYSNYLSIPTDCPQRDERYGWSADTQIFSATANYYSASTLPFLEKWMVDVKDASDPGGAFPAIAPRARFGNTMGDVGWADAGVIVPYNCFISSGDDKILKVNYPAMKKYMDFFLKRRKYAGPLPRYGDWLAFESNDDYLQEYLGVCFYALDALLMAKSAKYLGVFEDEKLYLSVYEKQKRYFIDTFVNESGELKITTQTALLYALKLNLLPNEQSFEKVKNQLKENLAKNGNKLQTGFLGTAILLPTLSAIGESQLAYSLLLCEEMPSWLFSVNSGATTIWERWNSYSKKDGFGEVGMNSFNHYAYGCAVEWIFAHSAGIRPKNAGYSDFILAPEPDKRLGCVFAEFNSENGKIISSWKYEGDKVKYLFQVPVNTKATFINPKTGEKTLLTSGKHQFVI